jgi:hypothetical protein
MTERERILQDLDRKWEVLLETTPDMTTTVFAISQDIQRLEEQLDALDIR